MFVLDAVMTSRWEAQLNLVPLSAVRFQCTSCFILRLLSCLQLFRKQTWMQLSPLPLLHPHLSLTGWVTGVTPVFIFIISLNLMLVLQMFLLMSPWFKYVILLIKKKFNLFFPFVLLTSDSSYTSAVRVVAWKYPSFSLWCVECWLLTIFDSTKLVRAEAAEHRNCETTTPEFDFFAKINIRVWQFSIKPCKCLRFWFSSPHFFPFWNSIEQCLSLWKQQ